MAFAAADSSRWAGDMLAEARDIIASAGRSGVLLRLIGGLGVLATSRDRAFAARPFRDIDLVGLRRQSRQIGRALTAMGFAENPHVRFATAGQTVQFFRPCRHESADGRLAHDDDRIDVYLDAFRLDHEIALRHRLDVADDVLPPADVLLSKLQHTDPGPDDLRDMVAILKDLELADADLPGTINASYLAALCARDWPLHHDVTRNLERCRSGLAELGLSVGDQQRAAAAVDGLEAALAGQRKSLRWRVRALAGERLPWSDFVDERDGRHIASRERLGP